MNAQLFTSILPAGHLEAFHIAATLGPGKSWGLQLDWDPLPGLQANQQILTPAGTAAVSAAGPPHLDNMLQLTRSHASGLM